MNPTKSITERVCQAIGFEGLALLICTPLLVWITGRPALEMGAVTLGISLLALSWNVIFNSLFDRLKARLQLTSGGWTRVVHALLFEGGLIILAVPLIAALMKISLLEAFILDIGVLRETLVRPVGEQLHQAAGLDRRVQAEVEHLRHGMPVFTHAV